MDLQVHMETSPFQTQATQRLAAALRQAMVQHGFSERKLATALGITIGTTQKYFRGRVEPMRVSTGISRELARLLGVTLDALVHFYETGEWSSKVTFEEVVSWLRSEAGVEHMAPILRAMGDASSKASCPECQPWVGAAPAAEPYTWPIEELQRAGVSDRIRERMGLTDDVLKALAERGEFTDEAVEAFSILADWEEDAVREAFSRRGPVIA